MNVNRRSALSTLTGALVIGGGGIAALGRSNSGSMRYSDLLTTFPAAPTVGYDYGHGGNIDNPGKRHWPMAYALVASAEARRAAATDAENARKRATAAARWLYNHRDRNDNGQSGWGPPVPWDAFSDGSTNPAHNEYGITTALVVQGLLDVVALHDQYRGQPLGEREAFLREARNAFQPFVKRCYNSYGFGRCFWYSMREVDGFDVLNVSAMLAGQMQRLTRYEVATDGFAQAADEAVRYLLELELDDESPNGAHWTYQGETTSDGDPPTRLNDTNHYTYIVDGLLTYANYGGQHADAIPVKRIRHGLATFYNEKTITRYPDKEAAARIWGEGYYIYVLAEYFPNSLLRDNAVPVVREYSPANLRPRAETGERGQGSIRHTAHLLAGLASERFLTDS